MRGRGWNLLNISPNRLGPSYLQCFHRYSEGIGSTLFVTRAKYAISFFSPVHGKVPARPIPMFRVAATINVNSTGSIFDDGVASLPDGMTLVA